MANLLLSINHFGNLHMQQICNQLGEIKAAFCEGGFLLCQAFNQLALVFRQLAGSHPLKNKWREPCHARM